MTPLILLHGALGSSLPFEALKKNLEAKGYEVHSFNFSGHGKTPAKPEGFTMPVFATDLLDYMNAQNIAIADVFGYSMGGYAALTFALTHPERIGKIMTLGTKFDWTAESSAKETRMLDPDVILEKVPRFAEQLEQIHGDWRLLLKQTAEMMLALGNGAALTVSDLSKITKPVQITLGSEDNMVSQSESEQMAAAIPGANFKILPTVKHPIEKVDAQMLAEEISVLF
jgi:pimeloyl-ACP methyl ester carboxylesterase